MVDCCMGRHDVRFQSDAGDADHRWLSTGWVGRSVGDAACRFGLRFLKRCRQGLQAPRSWTGAWGAVLAMAGAGFVLSASLTLPVAAPSVAMASAAAWVGTILLPVVVAAVTAQALPRFIGHADRRAVLWLLGLMLVGADLAAALAPGVLSFLAARALFGVALGGFWALALGLGGRLTAIGSATRARALLVGASITGGLFGALGLYLAGSELALLVPEAGQLLGDRLAFAAAAVLGGISLVAEIVLLPHLPDNGAVRRHHDAPIRLQAAE